MVESFGAIILAGGESSRMEQDKGLMLYKGQPMIQWVINAVLQVTENIVIVANDKTYEKFGYPVIPDKVKKAGPLAGMAAGMSAADWGKSWILACDAPSIQPDLLNRLRVAMGNRMAAVPRYNGRLYPLSAFYDHDILPVLEKYLAQGELKLTTLVEGIDSVIFDASNYAPVNFMNINSPKDL